MSALHLGRILKTLFLKLDPQPLSAINGVRLDVRARRRSLLTSPHPRRRLSPKCARKSALGASAFNAAVGRRYLGGTSRRSSRGGGHKEGPDDREDIGTKNQECGARAMGCPAPFEILPL